MRAMDTPQLAMIDDLGFASLLAPLTQEEFFASIRDRRPAHVPGPPDKFAFAMSWDALNRILDQSAIWTPQTLRLVLDTVPVPPEQYARQGTGRDGRPTRLVDFERVRALVGRGAAIVLNDTETLTPGMKRIAEILGETPGGRVQGNLYCSWKKHQAFGAHFDTHDVFAMQVIGEKIWRIYQRHFRDPVNHPAFTQLDRAFHEKHKGALLMEVHMRPGDLLYIPAGFYHEALAESGASVHVAFGIVPVIGLDVVSMLFERGVADELFRARLPHPSERGGKALDEHLLRLAGRMRELLRDPKLRGQIEKTIRDCRFAADRIALPDDVGEDDAVGREPGTAA